MKPEELQELIESVRLKESQVDVLTKQEKIIYNEARLGWDGIKQLIISGESLGDPLKEFIIVRYGALYEEIEKRYLDIQERFKEHQGQYIMLVKIKKERIRFNLIGEERPSDYIKVPELNIGVLSADEFLFNPPEGQFFFPTSGKHVTCSDYDSRNSVHVQEGDLTLGFTEDMGLNTSPDLQILVGDHDVVGWFEKQSSPSYSEMFCELNVIFKKSVSFPVLKAYVDLKQAELSEDYKILMARETLLEAESEKLKRLRESDPRKDKELQNISQRMERILAEAIRLGIAVPVSENPV